MSSRQGPTLSASQEDYLEAIYHIVEEKGEARGKEIAARLSVSGPSVTEALRGLAARGLINYTPYEAITLTSKGLAAAEDVVRRHQSLKQFFVEVLAIDDELAELAACRVEHAAPPEIIDRMVLFIKFLECCPRGGTEFVTGFRDFCRRGDTRSDCSECLAQCLLGSKRAPDRNDG